MENFKLNPDLMLSPAKIDPTNPWHRLNSDAWTWDGALIEALEAKTRHGRYFVREKSHKKLWDLVTYCGREDAEVIIDHYHFPVDLLPFLNWTYNWVAVQDDSWKWEEETGIYETISQMDWFPYEYLYEKYRTLN